MKFKHSRVAEAQKLTGGDVTASLLLLRIFDNSRGSMIRRNGFDWLVYPRSDWCKDVGISLDQYNRALLKLKKLNLVVVEAHLFGKEHRVIAHIRLPKEVEEALRGDHLIGENATSDNSEFAITQIQYNTVKNTDSNSFGITNTPYSPPNEEAVPGEVEMKITDVKSKYASPKKTLSPQSPPSPFGSAVALGMVWRKALSATGAAYQAALTQKQLGQLKQIGKQCPPGKAGEWLDHTVAQWQTFVLQVKAAYNLEHFPLVPDIGFVLKYIGEYIKFNLPAPAPSVKKPVIEAAKPMPVQLIAKSPKKATLEELQAILSDEPDADT